MDSCFHFFQNDNEAVNNKVEKNNSLIELTAYWINDDVSIRIKIPQKYGIKFY